LFVAPSSFVMSVVKRDGGAQTANPRVEQQTGTAELSLIALFWLAFSGGPTHHTP
jgi:hypothetical protein